MMTSRKKEHSFQETSTSFNEEATSSNLIHLTKNRPTSFKRRNSSRAGGPKRPAVSRSKSDADIADSSAPKRQPNKESILPNKATAPPNKDQGSPKKSFVPRSGVRVIPNEFPLLSPTKLRSSSKSNTKLGKSASQDEKVPSSPVKSSKSLSQSPTKPGSPRKQIRDNPFFRADSQDKKEPPAKKAPNDAASRTPSIAPLKKSPNQETPKSPDQAKLQEQVKPTSTRKVIRDSPFFKSSQDEKSSKTPPVSPLKKTTSQETPKLLEPSKPSSPRKVIRDSPFFKKSQDEESSKTPPVSPLKKTPNQETPKSPEPSKQSSPRKVIKDSPFFKNSQDGENKRPPLRQTSKGTRLPKSPDSSEGSVPELKRTTSKQTSKDEPKSPTFSGILHSSSSRELSTKETEQRIPKQASNEKQPTSTRPSKPEFPRQLSKGNSQDAASKETTSKRPSKDEEPKSPGLPPGNLKPTRCDSSKTDSQDRSIKKVNSGNPFAVSLKPVTGKKTSTRNQRRDSPDKISTPVLAKQNSLNNESSKITKDDNSKQTLSRSISAIPSVTKNSREQTAFTNSKTFSEENSDSSLSMNVKPVSPRRKNVRDEPYSNDSKTSPSINPVAKKSVKNETSNSKTNANASSPPSVRPTRKIFKDTSYLKPSESETELNKPSNDNYKGIESTINPIPPTEDDQQKSGESPKVSQGTAKFPVTFTPDPPRKVITSIDKSKDTQRIVASTDIPKPVSPSSVAKATTDELQTLSSQNLPTRPENRNLNDADKPNNTTPQLPVTFTPGQPRKVYRDELSNDTSKPATEVSTSTPTSEPSSYHIGELPLMSAASSEPELPPRSMSKETDPFDGITLRSNSTATIDIDDKERLIASDSDRSSSEIPSDNHQDISMNDRTSPTLESPTEFEIHNPNASSKENLVEAPVSPKSKGIGKGSFRLPGLDELRSKTLRKNKKGSDQNVNLIQHVIHNDRETDEGESGIPKRGGSVRAKGSSSQMKNQDDDHKPIKRSLSTGQTIREKLGSSGNSLRSGISRLGNSVTSRGLTKKASVEEKQGLISEDPDENTDLLVRIKDEEKTKEKEAEMALESRPPKEKRRLIGGQSANITSPKDQQPSIPSYKKLGENSEPSQPLFPTSPICDEQPTEVYKPLSASPKLGSKKSNEDEDRAKNELNTNKSEWSTGSKISWEKQKLLDNPDFSNQGFSSHQDNYSYNGLNQESQKLMTDENSTNLKPNVDNPYQPQRSDNDDLVISNESSTMTKYGDNHTEYGQNDAPLKRSLTWNSFKSPFRGGKSLKKAKSRDTVEEDSVVENQFINTDKKGGSYTPLAIRRAFSIKTFTPKLGRRRVDEKGEILDDKGCAKRNILSSLSLFSSSKSLNTQTELLDSDSEDDMQTELYESSFKKTNARNASQNSWLGKSGLLDSDEQPKSPNTFDPPSPALSGDQQRLNGTTASKSGAPSGGQGATAKPKGERQHLLQDDSEDSDEDLCLDRSIRSKSKNHKDLKDNRDKTSKKSSKLGGGLPSFRKKYSFDKL
eukprot:TCONS_00026887-protein